MMKKGSIAAVLFVLIVGIVGAVFLYGGGSSETGAMLLEQEDGSPSPTATSSTTSTTLMGSGCKCSGCTPNMQGADALGQKISGCCDSKDEVSPGKSCNTHCKTLATGQGGDGKGKGVAKCKSGACTGTDCPLA